MEILNVNLEQLKSQIILEDGVMYLTIEGLDMMLQAPLKLLTHPLPEALKSRLIRHGWRIPQGKIKRVPVGWLPCIFDWYDTPQANIWLTDNRGGFDAMFDTLLEGPEQPIADAKLHEKMLIEAYDIWECYPLQRGRDKHAFVEYREHLYTFDSTVDFLLNNFMPPCFAAYHEAFKVAQIPRRYFGELLDIADRHSHTLIFDPLVDSLSLELRLYFQWEKVSQRVNDAITFVQYKDACDVNSLITFKSEAYVACEAIGVAIATDKPLGVTNLKLVAQAQNLSTSTQRTNLIVTNLQPSQYPRQVRYPTQP